mmetsp:Transcript_37993/g.64954  ORF Transcript_37993/g.64954 Transcript_37993/m.64954 type:complete len:106 (-) Transcript_37993:71-388(-)
MHHLRRAHQRDRHHHGDGLAVRKAGFHHGVSHETGDDVRADDRPGLRGGSAREAEEEDGHGAEGRAEAAEGSVVVGELEGGEAACGAETCCDGVHGAFVAFLSIM